MGLIFKVKVRLNMDANWLLNLHDNRLWELEKCTGA